MSRAKSADTERTFWLVAGAWRSETKTVGNSLTLHQLLPGEFPELFMPVFSTEAGALEWVSERPGEYKILEFHAGDALVVVPGGASK